MKTKKTILLSIIFLVVANLQIFCQTSSKKYIFYGSISERLPHFEVIPPIYFPPKFYLNNISTFSIWRDSSATINSDAVIWHYFDNPSKFIAGWHITINPNPTTGIGSDVLKVTLDSRFYEELVFSTSLKDTVCGYGYCVFMSVCPNHNATIKPLGVHNSFRKNDVITLEVNGNFSGYLDRDFVWEYSLDGLYFQRRDSVDFFGRTLTITYDDIPGAVLGQPIYFRLKHCGSPYIPSNNAGSLPVVFTILPEFPEFSNNLYVADVRCPNQAPQPLSLSFKRPLETNATITGVYLFSGVIDGRVQDRMDLDFSFNADSLTIYFDEILPDRDYFFQMDGTNGGVSVSTTSITIRVRNPEALKFEKTVFPSSGTEYHQGIPKDIADGKILFSSPNLLLFSHRFSVFLNDTILSDTVVSSNNGDISLFDPTIKFSNLVPGTYSTRILYNSNQCDSTFLTTVERLDKSLNIRIDEGLPISCYGNSDASLQAVFVTPFYGIPTFSWKKDDELLPSETQYFLENLSEGLYSVIVESEGLQSTYSFTVIEPEEPELFHVSVVNPLCFGSDDGYIHIDMIGGTPPYHYVWDNGMEGDFIDELSAGFYRVIVYDKHNCALSHQIRLNNPPEMRVVRELIEHPTCHDKADGFAVVQVIGGTGIHHWTWNGIIGDDLLRDVPEGVYAYVVRDSHLCELFGQIEMIAPNPLSIEVVEKIEQSYFGAELGVIKPSENDGLIRISANGGTFPYTYEWSNGATGNVLSNLSFGTFHVTVRDLNSCEQTLTVELPQRFPLTANVQTISNISCFEADDAILQAFVEGGIPPYHYRWTHNNDDALQQFELGIGTYEFEVFDSRDVRSFNRIYVSQPTPLRAVLSADSVSGWGASDGSVHAVASGGTPLYTFEWGCSTAASVGELRAGMYHLRLTDANGCLLEDSIYVGSPDSLTLAGQVYHCTYFGSIQEILPIEPDDGRIDCKVEGGVKPYTYQWFYQIPNGEWSQLSSKNSLYIDSLTGGRYALLVTDNNGYSVSDTFEILKIKPLTASISATLPLCFGHSDGTLQALVNGGISPYTYRWNLGDSTALLQNLTIGHYAVVVQDSLGVLSTFELILTQPEPLSLDFSINEITGEGLSNGAIFTAVQGGIPPYAYLWTNHDTIGLSPQITNLFAGIYALQITDDHGCLLSTSFALNSPEAMEISATIKPVSYRGSVQGRIEPQPADGELYLTVSGGFPPYEYRWSNGEQTSYLTDLSEGSYSVTVTDKYGNEAFGSFDIKSTESLMLTVSQDKFIACFGDSSARLTSHLSGGTPPYDFLWNTGSSDVFIDSLSSGNYHLTVTDSMLVTANFTIRVDEPTPLIVAEHVIFPQCPNPANGAIQLFVSGGVSPYHYRWNTGGQTALLSGLSDGTYDVVVSDANGCQENRSFILQTPLTARIEQHDFIRCFGDSNVTLELIVCGGVLPYQIKWNTGDSTSFLYEQKGGLYTVIVTDGIGNVYETSIDVFEPSSLLVSSTFANPSCFGENDGSIAISAEGGTPPYVYRWSNMTASSQLIHLSGGHYSLFVTDRNGCQTTYSTTLVEPENLLVNLGSDRTLCQGQVVSIILPYGNLTYSWQKNGLDFYVGHSIDLSESGEYTVIAENEKGCKAFDTLYIETTSNHLTAEFWHSHEAIVGEDFVVANIGQTPFDYATWSVMPDAQVVLQNEEYFILRFSDEGEYEIRLTTHKNGCFAQQFSVVHVMSQQEIFDLKSTPISSLSDLRIFPNPAINYFNFSVQSDKPSVLHWTLTHVATGSAVLFGKTQTDSKGFATQHILLPNKLHGVYVFRVFSGKEQISSQLIIY
jgi:hypothetical protein